MNANDQEIEVKFYVADLAAVERRLIGLGAALHQPRVLEINLRFDTSDGDLRRGFRVLRLRQDERARLTYKGPGRTEAGLRRRQEIEFDVSDFEAARNFLLALDYQVSMRYEKYRTAYHLDGVEIALDEMPYGAFVEIEGPDEETIQEVSRKLDLDWSAAAPASYTALFEGLRQRMGLQFWDLSFDNFVGVAVSAELLGVRAADL